jgi:hypothetical protein
MHSHPNSAAHFDYFLVWRFFNFFVWVNHSRPISAAQEADNLPNICLFFCLASRRQFERDERVGKKRDEEEKD